jgi:hypothetical protein
MRRKFAPTHSICAAMRYIPTDDGAWRRELIDAEVLKENLKDGDLSQHPYWRYYRGETRFDLSDPALQPYLDPGVTPEVWRFRRLATPVREHVGYLLAHGRAEEAWRYVFERDVIGLEGAVGDAGAKLAALINKEDRSEETRSAIVAAAEDYAADAMSEIGGACYRGSRDLTVAEKKA